MNRCFFLFGILLSAIGFFAWKHVFNRQHYQDSCSNFRSPTKVQLLPRDRSRSRSRNAKKDRRSRSKLKRQEKKSSWRANRRSSSSPKKRRSRSPRKSRDRRPRSALRSPRRSEKRERRKDDRKRRMTERVLQGAHNIGGGLGCFVFDAVLNGQNYACACKEPFAFAEEG
eukprot:g9262.t2